MCLERTLETVARPERFERPTLRFVVSTEHRKHAGSY
jgi:hypothetical protein